MNRNQNYDVVIVGGGPAGLSAARTTARLGFSTLVIERQLEIGASARPCDAILTPVPHLLKGRRLYGDLFYPQLDLLIPRNLITGHARFQRLMSPGGYELLTGFSRGDSSPVVEINRAGLLNLLKGQAEKSGAEFRFGTQANGLVLEGRRVAGVRTAEGEVRGRLVLAAEGAARHLSRAAGLFAGSTPGEPRRRAYIAMADLVAPHVGRQHVGQIVTLGRRYTTAARGFGTVLMPTSGRASVSFTVLADGANQDPQAARRYLNEYIERDPRVNGLLAGAETLDTSYYCLDMDAAPGHLAREGFLSIGDAGTPAGHMGILPALYSGRKAALVAAEALDEDDVSAARLGEYARLYHRKLQRGLKVETDLTLSLASLADDDLDRLCQVLAAESLLAPLFTGWQGISWEAVEWLRKRYPADGTDAGLVQRMLAEGDARALPLAGTWCLPVGLGAPMASLES